jgi:hypothetical protein
MRIFFCKERARHYNRHCGEVVLRINLGFFALLSFSNAKAHGKGNGVVKEAKVQCLLKASPSMQPNFWG